jgi:hypothetical protein
VISRIHQRLGTAGFIISIIALVAALAGGAYAASGGLTGKQKKEVTAIAKKYAGTPGKSGTNGTNGTNGAPGGKGDTGATGPEGKQGPEGKEGPVGAHGKSVIVVNEAPAHCANGEGVTYEVEGSGTPNEVCSSAGGSAGLPKTLRPEETETGTWATGIRMAASQFAYAPISFTIPLAAELDSTHVKIVKVGEAAPSECTFGSGTPNAKNPQAKPGFLCIYEGVFLPESSVGEIELDRVINPATPTLTIGAATSGATLELFKEEGTARQLNGTWAVTGALGG